MKTRAHFEQVKIWSPIFGITCCPVLLDAPNERVAGEGDVGGGELREALGRHRQGGQGGQDSPVHLLPVGGLLLPHAGRQLGSQEQTLLMQMNSN